MKINSISAMPVRAMNRTSKVKGENVQTTGKFKVVSLSEYLASPLSFGRNDNQAIFYGAECAPFSKAGGVGTVMKDYGLLKDPENEVVVSPYYAATTDANGATVPLTDSNGNYLLYMGKDKNEVNIYKKLRQVDLGLVDNNNVPLPNQTKKMQWGNKEDCSIMLFRLDDDEVLDDKGTTDNRVHYFIFDDTTSLMLKPYESGSQGNFVYKSGSRSETHAWDGDTYAKNSKAFVELLPYIIKDKQNFDPATIVCSDSQTALTHEYLAKKVAANDTDYDGIKSTHIGHNLGDGYSGLTSKQNMFVNLGATKKQIDQIKADPLYKRLGDDYFTPLVSETIDTMGDANATKLVFNYVNKGIVPSFSVVSEEYAKALAENPQTAPRIYADAKGLYEDDNTGRFNGIMNPLEDPSVSATNVKLPGACALYNEDREENGTVFKKFKPYLKPEYEKEKNEDGTDKVDDKGNPVYKQVYKTVTDKDGNVVYEPKKDKAGKVVYELVYEPKKDENGNVVYETEKNEDGTDKLDDQGNPVRVPVYVPVLEDVKNFDGTVKKDAKGNPVRVPKRETVKNANGSDKLDYNGNPILKPVYKKDDEGELIPVTEPVYLTDLTKKDADGNLVNLISYDEFREIKNYNKARLLERFSAKDVHTITGNADKGAKINAEAEGVYNGPVIKPELIDKINSGHGDEVPLFVSWGRMDTQKGMDIVADSFKEFVKANKDKKDEEGNPTENAIKAQNAILIIGAGGEPGDEANRLKTKIKEMLQDPDFQGRVVHIDGWAPGYALASAADVSLVASRFEPCGLTDIESMKYYATPIVVNTHGLAQKNYEKTSLKTDHEYDISQELFNKIRDFGAVRESWLANPAANQANYDKKEAALVAEFPIFAENGKLTEKGVETFENLYDYYNKYTEALKPKIHELYGFDDFTAFQNDFNTRAENEYTDAQGKVKTREWKDWDVLSREYSFKYGIKDMFEKENGARKFRDAVLSAELAKAMTDYIELPDEKKKEMFENLRNVDSSWGGNATWHPEEKSSAELYKEKHLDTNTDTKKPYSYKKPKKEDLLARDDKQILKVMQDRQNKSIESDIGTFLAGGLLGAAGALVSRVKKDAPEVNTLETDNDVLKKAKKELEDEIVKQAKQLEKIKKTQFRNVAIGVAGAAAITFGVMKLIQKKSEAKKAANAKPEVKVEVKAEPKAEPKVEVKVEPKVTTAVKTATTPAVKTQQAAPSGGVFSSFEQFV